MKYFLLRGTFLQLSAKIGNMFGGTVGQVPRKSVPLKLERLGHFIYSQIRLSVLPKFRKSIDGAN